MRVSAGCSLAAHADASDPSDDPRRSARGRFCCRAREALDDIDGLAAESDVLLLVELEAALRELFQTVEEGVADPRRPPADLPGAPPDESYGALFEEAASEARRAALT
jgi:hypothetical protein